MPVIATHAGAVAGAWIYYLAIEVCHTTDPDADADDADDADDTNNNDELCDFVG